MRKKIKSLRNLYKAFCIQLDNLFLIFIDKVDDTNLFNLQLKMSCPKNLSKFVYFILSLRTYLKILQDQFDDIFSILRQKQELEKSGFVIYLTQH